jgi:hypothetical protein
MGGLADPLFEAAVDRMAIQPTVLSSQVHCPRPGRVLCVWAVLSRERPDRVCSGLFWSTTYKNTALCLAGSVASLMTGAATLLGTSAPHTVNSTSRERLPGRNEGRGDRRGQ